MKTGMSRHTSTRMQNDEWLTPPSILKELGHFDLDPCSPINRPWDTADKHYTIEDDGLRKPWNGRVWCNPPYGNESRKWLQKLVEHGNGIALIFARTETKMFFEYVWNRADALLFIEGRLSFFSVDGKEGGNNAGAPSVLIAYGKENAKVLQACNIKGKYIDLQVCSKIEPDDLIYVLRHETGYFFCGNNMYLGLAGLEETLEKAKKMTLCDAKMSLSIMANKKEWEIWQLKKQMSLGLDKIVEFELDLSFI